MNVDEPLRVTRTGGVVTVTIDIPPHNIVGADLVVGLFGLLPDLEADESVAVVVFRSADPDFFLMHGDVEALLTMPADDRPVTEPNIAAALFERVNSAPYLTIGVIDGYARGGGCEFLSALDLRIGTPRTIIGQPEVPMGILPGAGGTVRMARLLGRAGALELVLSGRDVDAHEALAIGWLQAIVADDTEADAWIDRFTSLERRSIAAVKYVIDAALDHDPGALVDESAALAAAIASGAHLGPMRRFLDAGGQTRAGETRPIDPLLEAMRDV